MATPVVLLWLSRELKTGTNKCGGEGRSMKGKAQEILASREGSESERKRVKTRNQLKGITEVRKQGRNGEGTEDDNVKRTRVNARKKRGVASFEEGVNQFAINLLMRIRLGYCKRKQRTQKERREDRRKNRHKDGSKLGRKDHSYHESTSGIAPTSYST